MKWYDWTALAIYLLLAFWKIDRRRQMIGNFKQAVYMKWHSFYWKVLHLTGFARPYSKLMCNLNLYRKFPDGRCQWCGIIHNPAPKQEEK